ncbi:hypothetical protein OBBRIDRAFT_789223 [Obba rivulosa]|uniref:DUF6533 domain-containing protein n=1 Tax=Obba rivulosa TaxID=1052685 RepID=A0A8E2DRR8_9APHY|nr:hypothetical protein OBBRIDRAFT_789223 [Obba rivulosa]
MSRLEELRMCFRDGGRLKLTDAPQTLRVQLTLLHSIKLRYGVECPASLPLSTSLIPRNHWRFSQMSDFDPNLATEVIGLLQSGAIQNYCVVAVAALIFHDHIATLSREMDLIWGRKFNNVTLMFHVKR